MTPQEAKVERRDYIADAVQAFACMFQRDIDSVQAALKEKGIDDVVLAEAIVCAEWEARAKANWRGPVK